MALVAKRELLYPSAGRSRVCSLWEPFLCHCRATVHIQVNDVNEYAPVFKEKSYKATVIEGKRYDNILKVEAVDADCSPQFSQICSYEIVTPDVPFAIDKDGKRQSQVGWEFWDFCLCTSMLKKAVLEVV